MNRCSEYAASKQMIVKDVCDMLNLPFDDEIKMIGESC
jgi:hypothetical protein